MIRRFQWPSHTQIPNEILDELMAELSGAEFKVLCYIARRTFGFHREENAISLHQIAYGLVTPEGKVLDRGTGLGVRTVVAAVKSLEDKQLICVGRTNAEQGHTANTYRILVADEEGLEQPGTPPYAKTAQAPLMQKLHKPYAEIAEPLMQKLHKLNKVKKESKKESKKERRRPEANAEVLSIAAAIEKAGVGGGLTIAQRVLSTARKQRPSITADQLCTLIGRLAKRHRIRSAGFFLVAIPEALTAPGTISWLAGAVSAPTAPAHVPCASCGDSGFTDKAAAAAFDKGHRSLGDAKAIAQKGGSVCTGCDWGRLIAEEAHIKFAS